MKQTHIKQKKKEKILLVCTFSKGICGVFERVKKEARAFTDEGHMVKIFSSRRIKGSDDKAEEYDQTKEGIEIRRFNHIKLGGESFTYFTGRRFDKAVREFKPTIIITHCYRHLHTTHCLKFKKELDTKVYLTTHGEFRGTDGILRKDIRRQNKDLKWCKKNDVQYADYDNVSKEVDKIELKIQENESRMRRLLT